MKQKTLREKRTTAIRNDVAEATRRRRRILQAGFLFRGKLPAVSGLTILGECDKLEITNREAERWEEWFYERIL